MPKAQPKRATAAQPGTGAIAWIAINRLQVEQNFEHVGRADCVAHGQWAERVTQAQRDGKV